MHEKNAGENLRFLILISYYAAEEGYDLKPFTVSLIPL